MASSSNPIAESETISSNYYHVFLNHHGADVKETLATHLYKRLTAKRLRVFLDKDELQEGDDIPSHLKAAIGSASVHIPIFSPNYAKSSWCLNELLLMLKSRKTIIPIFYGVKPDVLRWTLGGNGVYAEQLRILELKEADDSEPRLRKPRYDTNTMREWRKALKRASYIKGFVVKAKDCNSDDSQLVDKVVKGVLKKLPKTPLNVSKYPVGLPDKVEDFERKVLIPQQSGQTRVVGIVGLGGVGKTTLAKEIYNRERSKYNRSYFLFDVRQKALHSLQRALLTELTGSEVKIESTAEGIEELRRRVSSCRPDALVILDDVDNICQLDALLLPMKDALGSSSLILVTSRNKDVLTSFGIVETSIYKLEGLDPQHSEVLFCSHAFGQPHPAAQFQRVVQEFLDACKGLPLSLQVIGALLHGKDDLRYWKEQLQKISKILPKDIQSILKISYDGLDPEEKEIFLDIACFFTRERGNEEYDLEIRTDKDTAIKIWDGSGWNGWLGLRNLQNRCLVDVEDTYKKIEYLRMHDHLRDLGRDLAKKDPLRGHRLWGPTENLLHNLSDRSAVRGLLCLERNQLVDPRWDNRKLRRLELGNRSISMSRLELLRTPGYCLKDILKRVESPEYLIYLHCHLFPYVSLPRWIPMERLRVLDVQGYKLEWLWGDRNFQAPLQLRQLEITARLLKIPKSIGKLKYLEKIVVRPLEPTLGVNVFHKVPLETLPDEFCDLQCLEHLELTYCTEMKSLPESFGNLKKLQHLDLSGCSKLRTLPNSFRNLKQLKHLILICCTGLTISSETLGNITTLELIDMRYSTKIEVLPPQVAHQRSLSELCLTGTNIRKLPSAIGDLRDLKILDIGGPSLEILSPLLGCLRSLKELAIGIPVNRKVPDWLYKMNWEELGIDSTTSFSSKQLKCLPDSIGELNQLEKLSLNSTGLECLPPCIMALNNLQRLQVKYSPLRELPFKRDSLVECMLGLTILSLDSTRISEIAFGKGICPNLQRLFVCFCKRLAEVGTLPNTLTHLWLRHCKTLKNIEGLSGLANLRYLHIIGCPKVEELSGFGTLKSLDTLELDECGGITSIRGLQQLTKLRSLCVSDCCVLEELAGIEHLIGLRKLYVYKCPNMHCGEEVLKHLRQREEEGLLHLSYNPLGVFLR